MTSSIDGLCTFDCFCCSGDCLATGTKMQYGMPDCDVNGSMAIAERPVIIVLPIYEQFEHKKTHQLVIN